MGGKRNCPVVWRSEAPICQVTVLVDVLVYATGLAEPRWRLYKYKERCIL